MSTSKRVSVVVVGPGDLSAAPPWAQQMLEQWSRGKPWELTIYHEIVDGQVVQYMDLTTTNDGGVWMTGEHPALMRHIHKGSVDVIARAAMLSRQEGRWEPTALLEYLGSGMEQFTDEYAWLMGLPVQTVTQLRKAADPNDELKRLAPDAQAIWQGYYDQAVRAVNLQ